MRKTTEGNDVLSNKLDVVIRLLEDLFILESTKAGMKKEDLRKILAIDKNRIGRISKHIHLEF